MIRRHLFGAALACALALTACGQPGDAPKAGQTPSELVFAILPAENQQSMAPLWPASSKIGATAVVWDSRLARYPPSNRASSRPGAPDMKASASVR